MNIKIISKLNKKIVFLSKCCYKLRFYVLGRLLSLPRQIITQKFLYSQYRDLLSKKYNFENLQQISIDEGPIFILWLQGLSQMPEVVKKCYESITTNASSHKIILLTSENIKDYLDLPSYIYEKLESGIITKTHFSDIVRAGVLYKYGGTWIDATVFLSSPLTPEYFDSPFYGPCGFKSELKKEWKFLFGQSHGWTAWFLGTKYINYPLFDFLYNAFLLYWKNNSVMIDYFLIDFTISLFYKNNIIFKKTLDSRNDNNIDSYKLYYLLNCKLSKANIEFLKTNSINKLTYKHELVKEIDNEKTVYSHIILNEGEN